MTALAHAPTTTFADPGDRTAAAPPEHRGLARDGVRLLVGSAAGLHHTTFDQLTAHLRPGDLVVVNNSATVAAEADGHTAAGPVVVHVAAPLGAGEWVVELRTAPAAAAPVLHAPTGTVVTLPAPADPAARAAGRRGTGARGAGVRLRLREPYPRAGSSPTGAGTRLWRAHADGPLAAHLARYGRPVAYGYLSARWPLAAYQTVFAETPGSAEMPSAGRPFSAPLVARLVAAGVVLAPVTLHTGVSSQDAGEAPQPERFTVPPATARLVNATRAAGGRVVAVGTTVTRALESAADADGTVRAAAGWTELVIGPDRPVRVVTGLVSGLHNPEASHLLLVEAVAGPTLTQRVYDAAFAAGYLWHEFGDSCLLLP
ncbi:queuosine biosynthesis protein [Pilimelia terevasa]|uniref:Queuosine biosynthesis protein n=1 Tax=Pilimelia terevasa TaxID=53372 RepID=A0A8J3BTM5_9ACTN|nr:S-adenosylmethionine:tRNA ribosyltransferase-isomerase [Pilimelia terevasa]GGK39511.1 queuosine biosynthesis protein [Pilimelia terevasa]